MNLKAKIAVILKEKDKKTGAVPPTSHPNLSPPPVINGLKLSDADRPGTKLYNENKPENLMGSGKAFKPNFFSLKKKLPKI